ncbi:hypothetical protein AVEN_176849-1 [Araneus ventricosus]|uniref:Uncharacterized protein n=1 Tax=Araneus ventricosus TaxID=182803 RepID=A0A4Y2UTL1_ARAVE|nr:hypothetical protein AVEN_176849-1 [Araneus ventricosus]
MFLNISISFQFRTSVIVLRNALIELQPISSSPAAILKVCRWNRSAGYYFVCCLDAPSNSEPRSTLQFPPTAEDELDAQREGFFLQILLHLLVIEKDCVGWTWRIVCFSNFLNLFRLSDGATFIYFEEVGFIHGSTGR